MVKTGNVRSRDELLNSFDFYGLNSSEYYLVNRDVAELCDFQKADIKEITGALWPKGTLGVRTTAFEGSLPFTQPLKSG